ncbi:MAG: DivIVA domain-containing protein [Clostridia bacterium]|nr:DivIVA domain-containing protein [Clostridia bacterium]
MLTPLDIENKKFSKQMVNGYNVDEVDDFLDELTKDYAKLYKESTESKSKIDELNGDVEKYRTIESTLQSTLLMAQTTAEEVKSVAQKEAEQIIREAQNQAHSAVEELNTQIALKQKELEDVKKQVDVYKAKMEALLISQLELLKDVNKDE